MKKMNTIRIDNFDFVVRNIQQIQAYSYLNDDIYEDDEFMNSKKTYVLVVNKTEFKYSSEKLMIKDYQKIMTAIANEN